MKVYEGIDQFKGVKQAAVTIGTFDGVHLGHQKVIRQLKEAAASIKGESVILTFSPHPRMVLFPEDSELKLLNTDEEKFELIEKAGVDHLIVHPFSKKFSRIPYEQYVRDILVGKLKVKKLVIGYNHQFGRNREGNFQRLKSLASLYKFELERISAQDVNKIEVSSTKIRKALNGGDIKTANRYLGYDYTLCGNVVKGRGIGKKLGYPTANLRIPDRNKLIPASGIYAVTLHLTDQPGKELQGMLYIGNNPTVAPSPAASQKTIEVNIFDFEKDIYGKNIRIFLKQKIRDEKKFDNTDALRKAIDSDREKSLKILNA